MSISHLRFIIYAHYVTIDPTKIQSLQKWPTPMALTNFTSFLGLVNFYKKFIPRYLEIASPLHQLTHLNVPLKWIDTHAHAYNTLKYRLCSALVLVLPDIS